MATMQHLPQAAAQMERAAGKFLDSLTEAQKAKAAFEYMDGSGCTGTIRRSTATGSPCGT